MKRGSPTTRETAGFTARIAILADLAAGPLTRPQLRAHLPVQRRIDPGSATPPIACVLNEPPNSQLGLAERMIADLLVTNTFNFETHETGPKLHLNGLRKEIGPDPRLSYFPIRDHTSLACTIRPEGPVGLHFDSPQTRNPAYANSQYLLHLSLLHPNTGADLAELEESFAGISLARYADPDWCWDATPLTSDTLPDDRETWVEIADQPLSLNTDLLEANRTYLQIRRTALYKDGGDGVVSLYNANGSGAEIEALLFQPLGDNRLRVCAFAKPPEPVGAGQDNRPQLLASAVLEAQGPLHLNGPRPLRATQMSDFTFAQWVRTARDLSQLASDDGPIALSDLRGYARDTGLALGTMAGVRAITPPLAQRRYPLHVHRRLVHLLRKPATQIGAPVALFDKAALADATGASTLKATQGATLVLAEMETRANILRVQNGQLLTGLEAYDSAIFDLKSSTTDNDIGHIRLHIRPANPPLDLGEVEMQIGLGGRNLTIPASQDVILFYEDGQLTHWDNGAIHTPHPIPATDSLTLTLSGGGDGEHWVDVSVLQSRHAFDPTAPDRFDFDWLFTGAPALPDEPVEQALASSTLNTLPEAQARLIGLTDPIDIITQGN